MLNNDQNSNTNVNVQPQSQENDPDQDPFLASLTQSIKSYFASSQKDLSSISDLDPFLSSIGLLEIWNSEEEKQALWESLLNYQTIYNTIDCQGVIKGLTDLLSQKDDNYTDEIRERVTNSSQRKLTISKDISKAFKEIDIEKLIQIQKVFILLDLESKSKIKYSEIQELVNKYKFIKLSTDEIIKFLDELSEPFNNLPDGLVINGEYAKIAMKSIRESIGNFNNESDNVLYGDEGLINLNNLNNLGGNDGDGYNNYMNNILLDPNELIDDINSNENELCNYISALTEIKSNFTNLNNQLINYFDTHNNSSHKKKDIRNSSINNNIDLIMNSLDKKIQEFNLFLNEITNNCEINKSKIENLSKSVLNLQKENKIIQNDYKDLYEKFNEKQKVDLDDGMEALLDENILLTNEKEEKNRLIEKLEKELDEKENIIQSNCLKYNELSNENTNLTNRINLLLENNEKLKNEYDNVVNNILKKIESEEKEKEKEKDKDKGKNKGEKKLKKSKTDKLNDDDYLDKIGIKKIDLERYKKNTHFLDVKNKILQMEYDKLAGYALKLEMENYDTFNLNKTSSDKIKKLEENNNMLNKKIGTFKIDVNKLRNENIKLINKITDLKKEVEENKVFRPSNAMFPLSRISRMSRLSNIKEFNNKFSTDPVQKQNNINSKEFFCISSNKATKPFTINEGPVISVSGNKDENKSLSNKNFIQSNNGFSLRKESKEDLNDKLAISESQNKVEIRSNNDICNKELQLINKNIQDAEIKDSENKENNILEQINTNIEKDEKESQEKIKEYPKQQEKGELEIIPEIDKEEIINISPKIKEKNQNQKLISLQKLETHQIIQSEQNNSFIPKNIELISPIKEEGFSHISKVKSFAESSRYLPEQFTNKVSIDDSDNNNIDIEVDIYHNKDSIIRLTNKNLNINLNNNKKLLTSSQFYNDEEYEVECDEEEVVDKLNNSSEEIRPSIKINDQVSNDDLENILMGSTNRNSKSKNLSPLHNELNKNKSKQLISKEFNNFFNIEKNDKPQKEPKHLKKSYKQNEEILPNKSRKNFKTDGDLSRKIESIDINPNFKQNEISPSIKNNELKKKKESNAQSNSKKSKGFSNVLNKKEKERKKYYFENLYYEGININKDFLQVSSNDTMKRILRHNKDSSKMNDIFSDVIYIFEDNIKKIRRDIVITPVSIYIMEREEFRCIEKYPINKLQKITMSNKNPNFLVFNFEKLDDLLIETMRRLEMLYYLRDHFRSGNLKRQLLIKYEDQIVYKRNNKFYNIDLLSKEFSGLYNFELSKKFGYLLKYKNSRIIGKAFKERLMVLTNIGLIYFNDEKPSKVIPLIGSSIKIINGTKYKRPFCFEIKTNHDDLPYVFSCHSKEELDSWIDEFISVQVLYEQKMKSIDIIQNVNQDIDVDIGGSINDVIYEKNSEEES